jgi:hypothetical protein
MAKVWKATTVMKTTNVMKATTVMKATNAMKATNGMKATTTMKAIKSVKAMKIVAMKEKKVSVAIKSMKLAKAMKAVKLSKRVTGRLARFKVFTGGKELTTSGRLKKADLTKNRLGKIVSKRRSARAKQGYASTIGKWTQAVVKARYALGIKGFLVVKKGSPVYNKAREFYKP